jgi:plasmid stabilization system protein ParE
MRQQRLSKTFLDQLAELIEHGERVFGPVVANDKRKHVYKTIQQFLTVFPDVERPDPHHGLRAYPIHRTPFVVLYDFDEDELRVHFVFHKSADLRKIDPASAQW